MIRRSQRPENTCRPASFCTVMTLKGLNVAAVKPKATATKLMPMPVSESQPIASETATAIGTRVRLSSRMPAVELKNMHAKVITAISKNRRDEKRSTMEAIR